MSFYTDGDTNPLVSAEGGANPASAEGGGNAARRGEWSLLNVGCNAATLVLGVAILGMTIALLVYVRDEGVVVAGLADAQQTPGQPQGAGKGGGGGGGGGGGTIDNPLCEDPSDLWPAAEFPMRDTDVVAATFCSKCKSQSTPVCSGPACRIEWQHVTSHSPAVTQATPAELAIGAVGPVPAGYFRFQVLVSVTTACPVRKVEVALWDETDNMQLGESELVNGFAPSLLLIDRIVDVGHRVSVRVMDPIASDRVAAYGRVLRSSLLDRLMSNTAFDAATKVKWIPERPLSLPPPGASPLFPGQFPNNTAQYTWLSSTIPAGVVQSPLPTLPGPLPPLQALPDNDGYTKKGGVPTSIDVFFGRNVFTGAGTEEALDIFDMALEDRGLDKLGRRNHRKMVYMTPLTAERSLLYVPKIRAFVNRVYSKVVTNDGPLLSSFKSELLDFFLDMHWGEDPERPAFVREYFRLFLDIIGFGDPTVPGRNEAFMYGADHLQDVRDYARAQTTKIIAAGDKTAIVYGWAEAGLPVEAQLTEAVHNVVAFSQFNHHLFLVVRDKLTGTPWPAPLPPVIQYNFLDIYASLPTDELKLNLIRETYRLLLPNGNDFSRVVEASPSGEAAVQARHLRLPIELTAYTLLAGGNPAAGAADFLNLNLTQYNDPVIGDDFNTDFTSASCPYQPGDAEQFFPELQFDVSAIDGETLVDLCNPKMFPVFKVPKYFPFGAGYRRCAGEAFNMLVTKLVFDRFAELTFEQRAIPPDTPLVTLAPFVAKPDDIYFKKSLVVVP